MLTSNQIQKKNREQMSSQFFFAMRLNSTKGKYMYGRLPNKKRLFLCYKIMVIIR